MGHADKVRVRLSELREKAAEARGRLAGLVAVVEPTAAQTTERDGLVVELRQSAEAEASGERDLRAAEELDASELREAELQYGAGRGASRHLADAGLPLTLRSRRSLPRFGSSGRRSAGRGSPTS